MNEETKTIEDGVYVVLEYITKGQIQLHAVVHSFEDGELFMRKVLKINAEKVDEIVDEHYYEINDVHRFSGPVAFYQDENNEPVHYISEDGDETIGFNFMIVAVVGWSHDSLKQFNNNQ